MSKLRAYVALTKPRVIELLLVTTVPAMILANAPNGFPDIFLVINVLIGGTLSAGSANAFNCYIDADIDKIMQRTKNRPLVTGEISKREALVFAYVTAFASSAFLLVTAGWLAALLSLGAILFYVLIYTLLLKRKTPQNIVWGGAAGAMPVLIGWAAVTKDLSVSAWLLFLVIFLWTPPHYWPLSMKYRDDYASAGVPMLPVVRNPRVVGAQILLYTWAMVASSLLLIPAAQMGVIYTITAGAFGIWFTIEATILYRQAQNGVPTSPMRLFHGSISYLTVLFLAVAVDALIPIAFFG
ncbi:MAG: protoheme IX farnesyltransferase [Actinobacteria bacterium]|uniref:Protoheme IX farnesyltransferase n=1 Tax=freshwater metagenome TaxID=449393 RepID=A0A6J6HR24_9ZZZZ|nr:protoheme IX farnesyltransferase [Actinomycetota bacterium]